MPQLDNSLIPHDVGGDGDCFFRSVMSAFTADRRVINKFHPVMRSVVCDFINVANRNDYPNPEYSFLEDGAAELRQLGVEGEVALSAAVANIFDRNVIVVLNIGTEFSLRCYCPSKRITTNNFAEFDQTPIIIYHTPGHFQSMKSADASIAREETLKKINLIIKERITSNHPTDVNHIEPSHIESKDVLPVPKKIGIFKLILQAIIYYIKKIFSWVKTDISRSEPGVSLNFFRQTPITIIYQDDTLHLENSTRPNNVPDTGQLRNPIILSSTLLLNKQDSKATQADITLISLEQPVQSTRRRNTS